jgi:hypothetical protein
MYEARVVASMQNLFPMVFGQPSSSGLDDSEFLPALQDPGKWDNGITGLQHQLSRNMSNVEFQIESIIDSILIILKRVKLQKIIYTKLNTLLQISAISSPRTIRNSCTGDMQKRRVGR